ncbi:cytochrome P450 [Ramlibacter sp. WS9]|uniref:cytochrome P450 n=1 Tax=Ramlibacter sp. WS9 TaxID=1882741 RepID=UPI00130508D8|nr:cytochrome P450 [Ramlibacter sp. WS9]
MIPRDPVAAATHADPYPYYARLRRESPVGYDSGLGLWVAATADAVQAALAHPALRVRPAAEPVPKALVGTPVGEVFARLVRMNDGEFHARHRPDVQRAAARFTLADVAGAAEEAVRDLAPRVNANAFLSAVPVQSIARLLGVPPASLDRTVACVEAFVQGIGANASGQMIALANDAVAELVAQGEAQGLDPVRSANRIALMQQSLDATAGLIGNTVLSLRRRPEVLAPGARPEEWRAVVSEVARWDPPVQNTRRFAATDLVLAGETITQGQGVLVLLASANRDPGLNNDPDAFDAHRAVRRGLGFGAGAHACPGESIAVEIAAAALRTLVASAGLGLFAEHTGYRPLPNARIPTFSAVS